MTGADPDTAVVYATLDSLHASLLDARAQTRTAIDAALMTIRVALEHGTPINLTECARRTGIARATIYNRLPPELIAAARDGDSEAGTDA